MKTEEMYHEANQNEFEQRKPAKHIDIIKVLQAKKNDVLNGNEDAYKVMLLAKRIEDEIKKIKSEILEQAIEETMQAVEFNGYRFENTASGRYDYSNNIEWKQLNDAKKQLETDMKLASKSKNNYINEETGEIIQPAVYKPNKTSVKITKIK